MNGWEGEDGVRDNADARHGMTLASNLQGINGGRPFLRRSEGKQRRDQAAAGEPIPRGPGTCRMAAR